MTTAARKGYHMGQGKPTENARLDNTSFFAAICVLGHIWRRDNVVNISKIFVGWSDRHTVERIVVVVRAWNYAVVRLEVSGIIGVLSRSTTSGVGAVGPT